MDPLVWAAPQAFHVMIKPRGAICNLDCAYYYFLSKERLYPGSEFRMPDDVLKRFTRQYMEAQRVPEVTFGWQGGEPTLMGLDFFRRAVALQKEYRRAGMKVLNALQTNGTTLNDEWCRFFREHDFLIGLSLDGLRELHDAYRVDRGGGSTFDRVMTGLELLKTHGVAFNILTTVHAVNAGSPLEVYRFLRDEVGAAFIQFIPIVERDNETGFQEGERVTERSVTSWQYGDFLIAVFDEWVRRDVAGLNYLCEGYKTSFAHVDRPMRLMADELRRGRPPANVMLRLAQEEAELERRFTRARRNDPCPCGSGEKFKYCHGRSGRRGKLIA